MIKTIFVTIILSLHVNAGLLYTYNQLTLKDLDQMNAMVTNRLKESKAAYSGKIVPIKEGLQAVYSRPNSDDMIDKISPPLRSALEAEDATEKVFEELVQEAINALKNTKNFKKEVQVTYAIFLENVISEFKPSLKPGGFEFTIIKKIADSDIELTKDAEKDRKLRLMQESSSPSAIASKVLKNYEERLKSAPAKSEDELDKTEELLDGRKDKSKEKSKEKTKEKSPEKKDEKPVADPVPERVSEQAQ